jgi:hypothetical protein
MDSPGKDVENIGIRNDHTVAIVARLKMEAKES